MSLDFHANNNTLKVPKPASLFRPGTPSSGVHIIGNDRSMERNSLNDDSDMSQRDSRERSLGNTDNKLGTSTVPVSERLSAVFSKKKKNNSIIAMSV